MVREVGARVNFTLAGEVCERVGGEASFTSYRLPEARLSVKPEHPVEGRPFTIIIEVENPSNLTVSDMVVEVTKPQGLKLLEGSLMLKLGRLEASEVYSERARLVADRALPVTLSFSTASFTYVGQRLGMDASGLVVEVLDDMLLRYGLPSTIALASTFILAAMLRRRLRG